MRSTVVGGAMLPHAPQFFTMPDTEDKKVVEQVSYNEPQEKFSSSDAFPLAYRLLVTQNSRQVTKP